MYYNNSEERKNIDKLIVVFLSIITIALATITIYLIIKKETLLAGFIGVLVIVFFVVIEHEIANMKTRDSILMPLLIMLSGIIFVLLAILTIIFYTKQTIKNVTIKNEGVKTIATIIDVDITDYHESYRRYNNNRIDTASYTIEYIIEEQIYRKRFSTESTNGKKGDLIYIYYMPNNIDETYIPMEHHTSQIIIIPISLSLGIACISYSLVKRSRNVKYNKI